MARACHGHTSSSIQNSVLHSWIPISLARLACTTAKDSAALNRIAQLSIARAAQTPIKGQHWTASLRGEGIVRRAHYITKYRKIALQLCGMVAATHVSCIMMPSRRHQGRQRCRLHTHDMSHNVCRPGGRQNLSLHMTCPFDSINR